MVRRVAWLGLGLLLLGGAACSSDDGGAPGDAGDARDARKAEWRPPSDAARSETTGWVPISDAALHEGLVGDVAPSYDSASGPDITPAKCFELSLDPNVPLALDGTFSKTSPRWRRPYDDPPVCPATALLPTSAATVPFVTYAFCNKDTVAHTFDFEMLSQKNPKGGAGLDDPFLILYRGQGIGADPLKCLAINDDIPDALTSKDSEITGVVVPPGGAITLVGTTSTFSTQDSTGQGYYILVVTVADP